MNKVDKVICKNYYYRDFIVLKRDYFDGILLTQDFCSIKFGIYKIRSVTVGMHINFIKGIYLSYNGCRFYSQACKQELWEF